MSSDGDLEPAGARVKVGLKSVARAVGVCPSTVSNAYNRPDQLSPALRERVLSVAAELGYPGPDPVARSLRTGRASAIGIVFHECLSFAFDDAAAVRFLQGVSEVSDVHGLAVVLVPGLSYGTTMTDAVRRAAVDGLLLHGLVGAHPLLSAALSRRLPLVVVDGVPVDGADFVGIDDALAAETATRHLLELGHRRIGFLSLSLADDLIGPLEPGRVAPAPDSVARRRLLGCARALAAFGLDWSDVAVQECGPSTIEAGRDRTHALLEHGSPTAVFAFSDALALGAKLAAAERGLTVPGDLSIVGFDGTAPAGERLTSIHQSQRTKGRVAAERLIRALGSSPSPAGHELLPTELVLGQTTGRPPHAAA
jgi:DNA-binding LacI/PurR family transcriptional regulator